MGTTTWTLERTLEVLNASGESFPTALAAYVGVRAAAALAALPQPIDGSLASASNVVLHADGAVTLASSLADGVADTRPPAAVLAMVLARLVRRDASTPELVGIAFRAQQGEAPSLLALQRTLEMFLARAGRVTPADLGAFVRRISALVREPRLSAASPLAGLDEDDHGTWVPAGASLDADGKVSRARPPAPPAQSGAWVPDLAPSKPEPLPPGAVPFDLSVPPPAAPTAPVAKPSLASFRPAGSPAPAPAPETERFAPSTSLEGPLELARDRSAGVYTPAPDGDPLAEEQRPRRSRATGRVVMLAITVLVLGGFGYFVLWSKRVPLPFLGVGTKGQRGAQPVLLIDSIPPGATVRVDGVDLGVTPLAQDNRYPARDIDFQLLLKGYRPHAGRFRGAEDVKVDVPLLREGAKR